MSATVPPDLLAALVPDAAVLVGDGDGLVRGFNTGAAQLFGPGLQPGRAMCTLIGPEHRKALQALLAEPPADEQTQTVTRRLPLRLETGAPAGLSPRAMLRVGLRHAGLRLWQFEELGRPERQQADWLLARFMRLSPGAPFALELDGTPARLRFTIISPGLCRAFGRDEHELAAPDFRVLPHVHAQDRDALAQAMREAALHLTDFHHEFRLMHPLRGPVWHEARATVEIDATGRPGAFGRDEHELAAPDFRVLPHVHAQDRDALAQAMREAALHLTDFHHEFRLMHPLRGPVWHEARATVEIDATGRPGAYGYLLDISARKRAEQQLEAMHAGLEQRVRERTAELEAKHREMERFTYSVSHDLKAPLRGLDGYSRLLLAEKRDQLDDEGRLFIDNIRQAARQMSQLIEDLLAYSRVERLRPTLVALPLRGLIDEALAELDDSLRRQAAEIRIDTGTLSVRGERRGLLLVLRNLLDNAIKFRRPDRPCQITITARPLEAPGGGTELTIADNGIGFDMRYHDRIFEIFQRLHRVEDYPGTGIGLAIVRKAMERMNGRIHARAEPGRGATFVLEFPPAAGSIGGQDP